MAPTDTPSLLSDTARVAAMKGNALAQLDFFRASLREDGGFDTLEVDGSPVPGQPQDLMTTARLIHSYAIAHIAGAPDCLRIVDAGMAALATDWPAGHRDAEHGGYLPIPRDGAPAPSTDKQAYGHVFVLLAAASAKSVGHPDADRLLAEAAAVIEARFWDEETGRLQDEFRRDWQVFSDYRGMNANMHGVEAFLAAYEATGDAVWLTRAGRILDFFTGRVAPEHDWRLPEHYRTDWSVDAGYEGNPMFRPAGTTPGHSLELGRLLLQYWDLTGRADAALPERARKLIETAAEGAWREAGGFAYTLDFDGTPLVTDRYWWPVTEGIGAFAALAKQGGQASDLDWYARLWQVSDALFIDAARGGWFPEVDEAGQPVARMFTGKPDIYHALQACLFPLAPGLSGYYRDLKGVLA
ncbi:AGE family epimerase/isomerase [Salipiger sp. H15]|uniref:AGE family epimerase/isomerase n=1 Tax=Alloyangia sp. H15 TaxID=3029062 RepID=A0AAU8AE22_9RHOB